MLPLWHFPTYLRNKSKETPLIKLFTQYNKNQLLEIEKIELIPEKPNSSKTGKQDWQPVNIAIHTKNGKIIIEKDNYF